METCHPVSLPCKGTNILIFVTCLASFYLWVWSVQPLIQSLYLWVRCIYMQECSVHLLILFYFLVCNKFLHARMLFTLTDTTFILMFVMYLHARMFCTLAPFVLYSHGCNVRPWNLFWGSVAKSVLSQLMILLTFTLPHTSSIPMGGINFYLQERFLHSLIPLLFKCLYIFYSHGCNVRAWNLFWASVAKPVLWQLTILLSCTLSHTSYIPMGATDFYMQEHFLHSLIRSHQVLPCPVLIGPWSQIIRPC